MSITKHVYALKEVLNAKQIMILRYREEAIINYKAFVIFKRRLERSGVVLYQYRYYVTLAHFKMRYPKEKIEKDLFFNYPRIEMSL
ncbi:hypothetical protein GW17_00005428 [Ensete ventricosum]|nr:hypothetical protein GW17_00005428 [Ensete ventricosum]